MGNLVARACAAIDRLNDGDPKRVVYEGKEMGAEVLYGRRMSARLESFHPDPPPALAIAARAQHVARFRIPRSTQPEGRAGYLKWRKDLAKMHGSIVRELLESMAADDALIQKVSDLVQKKNLGKDPLAQTLEDVACLVFLEHYFEEFAERKSDDALIRILQKTWKKMSHRAHDVALSFSFSDRAHALVYRATQTG